MLRRLNVNLILSLIVVLGAATVVFAQDAPPSTPDWWLEGANAITLLAPALVRIGVWGAFFFVRRVPIWALPIAAVLLGVGYDAVDGLLWTNPALVAAKGLLMLLIREVIDKYFAKPLGLAKTFTKPQDGYIVRVNSI
jgi:hypothetical protein